MPKIETADELWPLISHYLATAAISAGRSSAMLTLLVNGLHSRSGLVRKGCILALKAPHHFARRRARAEDYAATPPVLANSVPKSGTHLLDQIVEALPGRCNYGGFLSSMTSSFRFRRRSDASTAAFIDGVAPGEIVRAHLFFSEQDSARLREKNFVHYFIYRDPRDVAISEAHYLRSINRWHRLHKYFRDAPTLEEAITMSIRGLPELAPAIDFPNIGERFRRYAGWLSHPDVCAVRFEDLRGEGRDAALQRMAQFYADRAADSVDVDATFRGMQRSIDPERSHTYRKGETGGWRTQLTEGQHKLFSQFATDALQRFGYE